MPNLGAIPGFAFGPSGDPPKPRDAHADHLKAVNDAIAERENAGLQATPYLLVQKTELEAKLGIVHKSTEPTFEHAATDPLPENAIRRGPGRPRKPSDADRATGS